MNSEANSEISSAEPRSLLWLGLEAATLAAVSFVVLAALARTLEPATFGLAATALALVQIACSCVEALFHDALVQRRDLSAAQQAAAHTLGVAIAAAATLGLVAWGVAAADTPRASHGTVASLAAWMAPAVLATGASAAPLAMLRRRLAMREAALISSVARLLAGAIAIGLLAGGAGVWGLVAHQNLSALLLLVGLAWRGHAPLRGFGSPAPARALWRFALANSLHGLLSSNRARLFQLMSALVMPARMVGELALALRLVEMLAAVVVTGVARATLVRLAAFAHEGRDSAGEFLALTRRFGALALPIFVLMAALATPLVQVVGDRGWSGAAALVASFALAQALRSPLHLAAPLLSAHGRPQLNLWIVVAELFVLAALAAALHDPLSWVWRLVAVIPLTLWCLHRVAGVEPLALLGALHEPLVAALGMWLLLAALLPALPAWPPIVVLLLGTLAGATAYAAMLSLLWRSLWRDLRGLARL